MISNFSESTVEEAVLAWLESAGWQIAQGLDIGPNMPAPERHDGGDDALAGAYMREPREARQ